MLRPMRMNPLLRLALPAVAVAMTLTSCGSDGDRDLSADDASPAPTSPDEPRADTMVSCGGDTAWSASAMTEHLPHGQSSDVVAALEAFASDRSPDLPPLLRDGTLDENDWFQLAGDGHGAAIATGPWGATGPGKGAQVIYLDNTGGWKVTSWGDCNRLVPFLAEGQWVEITGVSGDRDTETPALLVNEVSCTGGRDPRPHLNEPTVVETDDSVTVSWTSAQLRGNATCIGNVPVPARITLDVPLGDRVLYDGSRYPAREVG